MFITAVAQEEKDGHDNTQETGICVTYPKPCSRYKNNNSRMLFFFSTLLLSCFATYLPQLCLATSIMATSIAQPPPPPVPAFECGSRDIRNTCDQFKLLDNCTVITGFLDIVLLPLINTTCDFTKYQFKNLREITGFFILNDVRHLINITNMFPYLTVIRGQQLFLNYALAVSGMPHLERLEFRSLVAIQRGHIVVKSNPKLCNTEGIYWDRLTLTPGENHIMLTNETQCPTKSTCKGCPTDYCWSNQVCQKFENNNVLSVKQNIQECHKECLGGCYNNTAQGCTVCKTWTDHGTCVSECPRDKYACEMHLRCYTREECVVKKKLYVYKNTCVESCPGGYKLNNATGECDSCSGIDSCQIVCTGNGPGRPILITHLMNAEALRGCQILNTTVLITIHNRIDEEILVDCLKDVREIMGHLKINRSPYLTTLNFFQNLEKIHGNPMESNQYSMIVYNNKNLKEFWKPKHGFELVNGGMYIQSNNKLCNRHIKKFREIVKHDNSKDSYQTSDQEVLCSPAKLNLYLDVLTHSSLKFTWPKDQTSNEVEIIYRPIAQNEQLTEDSELDTPICKRINWRRELKFPHELNENSTHYSYIVKNLAAHTKYAALVKTFGKEYINDEARSEIKYATTRIDIPRAPIILITSKTYNSLQIELQYENREDQFVDYYILKVHEIIDDKDLLDTRDYCQGSYLMHNKDNTREDYDDCCSKREQELEDHLFLEQLKNDFHCSLDRKEYCDKNHEENNLTHNRKAILTKRLEHRETNYTVLALERYHLYVIQVQACNHAGCSSHNMISTRTNYSITAEKLSDFKACRVENTSEYQVRFTEPKLPNSYITFYNLHFRYNTESNETRDNDLACVSRLDHEHNKYLYVAHINKTFNQAAVRVFSLNHQVFNEWINITTCDNTKYAGKASSGANIFLIFFLIGATGTGIWVCYKRRYCHRIPHMRRCAPIHLGIRYVRQEEDGSDDRQILVEGLDTPFL